MKYYCVQCQLLSASRNFWCQRNPCGANRASLAFGYGDYVEDIKITRLLYFLDGAILYLGERGRKTVLVKVAFPGCDEQLIREARTLFALQATHNQRRFRRLRRPYRYPYLPILLPAYVGTNLNGESLVGHTTHEGNTLIFSVLHYAPDVYENSQLLEDVLLEDAQPWYQNAVWLTTALADVITLLHNRHQHIGNLSPRHVLIRRDQQGVLRPILISMGINTDGENKDTDLMWLHTYADPRYLAPELTYLDKGEIDFKELSAVQPRADVYSLALMLLEMLNGRRNFVSHKVETPDQIRRSVIAGLPIALMRPDLEPERGASLENAIRFSALASRDKRIQDTVTLVNQLVKSVPTPIPPETRRIMQTVSIGCMIVITVLVTVIFVGVVLVQNL